MATLPASGAPPQLSPAIGERRQSPVASLQRLRGGALRRRNCADLALATPKPPPTEGDSPYFAFDVGSLDFCGLDYIALGALAGAAVAAIVDASLAFERVDGGTESEPVPPRLPTIEPTVSVAVGGVAFGLGAAF